MSSFRRIKKTRLNAFSNLEVLKLQKTNLDQNSIDKLSKIRSFVFNNCDLSRFGHKSFQYFSNVFTLSNFYPKDPFDFDLKDLVHLKTLHIENIFHKIETSQLTRTLRTLGSTCTSLICLRIVFSQMSSSNIENVFQNIELPNLEILDLTGSILDDVDHDLFGRLKNLKELILCKSSIKSIDFETMNKLSNLKSLNLNYNKIVTLKNAMFSSLSELESLSLKSNRIEFIEKEAFKGLGKLSVLNLSQNIISSVDPEILLSLSNLKQFFLIGRSVM